MKRFLLLSLMLLVAACETPTAPEARLLPAGTFTPQMVVTDQPSPAVAGVRVWYTSNRFWQVSAAHLDSLNLLPPSGWLVGMVYYVDEYAPGAKYRLVMMGTQNMIYNPAAIGTWGAFENTDENKGQAQARLGKNITVLVGAGIENAEYWTAVRTAFDWVGWP